MSIWEYIILFLSVILGGGIALLIKRNNPRILRMSLSFSGAYILGIAALHLMPVVFANNESAPGLWMLAGFFIQLLLRLDVVARVCPESCLFLCDHHIAR